MDTDQEAQQTEAERLIALARLAHARREKGNAARLVAIIDALMRTGRFRTRVEVFEHVAEKLERPKGAIAQSYYKTTGPGGISAASILDRSSARTDTAGGQLPGIPAGKRLRRSVERILSAAAELGDAVTELEQERKDLEAQVAKLRRERETVRSALSAVRLDD